MTDPLIGVTDILDRYQIFGVDRRILRRKLRTVFLLCFLVGVFEGAGWLLLYLNVTGVFGSWL